MLGRDAPLLEPLRPQDKAVETGRPVHDLERLRVGALKPDFKPGEPGRGQQVRQRFVDRLGPDFAEEADALLRVQPADPGEKPLQVGARIQGRVQQVHLANPPFHRPGDGPQQVLLLREHEPGTGFVVIAEAAAVGAAALGLEQHEALRLGFEPPAQIGAWRAAEDVGGALGRTAVRPEAGLREQPAEDGLAFAVDPEIHLRRARQGIVRGDLRPAENDPGPAGLFDLLADVETALDVPAEDREAHHVGPAVADRLHKRGIGQVGDYAFRQDVHRDAGKIAHRLLQAGGPQGDIAGFPPEILPRYRQLNQENARHAHPVTIGC